MEIGVVELPRLSLLVAGQLLHHHRRSRRFTANKSHKALSLPARTHSFPRRSRLSSAGAYQRVFSGACGKSSDRNVMILATANGLTYARLGLAISKKKTAAATARNRIKRVVRESFRHHQEALRGLDLVVLNNANAGLTANNELFRLLATHWNAVISQCRKS